MSSKTADVIAAALCERIENGEFVTRRLPAERALSEQYSTTRITLREAQKEEFKAQRTEESAQAPAQTQTQERSR